ncbi:MAG: ATP-binding protein, partial [Thermoguttaceae bacterium]|nr:ATP-binding protein [Thermoguttaceae bacterium]
MAKIIVSARAVEMLGRQQIAGVSTALSELLKNAHDAYASDVSVEAYSSKSTLIIRDNGRGMSPDDFQRRWLTLGTDSKAEGSTLPLLAKPDERPERAIVGEKGIGRLALALLGRHLLVVTRAQKSKTELDKIVVAYIPWDIFDVPGLTLSEIDIPVVELDAELPDERIFSQLRESFLKQFDRFEAKGAASELLQAIRVGAEKIEFDVRRTAPKLRDAATFDLKKSTGTHFYVFESNPTINEEFDELKEFRVKQSEANAPVPDIYKSLIGFSNKDDSSANGDRFDFKIARVDENGVREPLFDEGEFCTEEIFRQLDHTFQGDFDKTGRFRGRVTVFGKEHEYELAP